MQCSDTSLIIHHQAEKSGTPKATNAPHEAFNTGSLHEILDPRVQLVPSRLQEEHFRAFVTISTATMERPTRGVKAVSISGKFRALDHLSPNFRLEARLYSFCHRSRTPDEAEHYFRRGVSESGLFSVLIPSTGLNEM